TPVEAAHREVLEETGHAVAVHEFLGTIAYNSGGRSKIVHFWRMEAQGGPVRDLMRDIKAVDWVTLDDALARLSRDYERAFLAQIGPIVLATA
ncbi:NUDIX domain-containing protein, partial [Acinetobacter baumannii]